MRHAFDVRKQVSIPTFTGDAAQRKPSVSLAKATSPQSPPLASVSIDQVESDERPLMLRTLFPEAQFFGGEDVCLTQLALDASMAGPGDLVVYRIGEGDPNELISEALARGAGGILTEQLLPCPLPQCIVGSVDHALARIASVRNQRPDRNLLTVGVLGHSGKTSTCLLAATLTKALGIRTAYQCDLGASDGVVNQTPSRRMPVGAELIEWLAESSDCLSRVALIEIDEPSARHGHYDSMQFDVLIVTGRRQLAEDFGPCGLQCLIDRLTPTGIVIAPDDDIRTTRLLESASCHQIRYGTTTDSEFSAIMIDQSGGMSTLMLCAGDSSAMMETPLCGKGMASNLAAVSAFGSLLGHTQHKIAEQLGKLRSIPGRGQRLVDFGRATVVLETGGSVDRVREALRTAKAAGCGGRVWCVMSIGEGDSEETLAHYGQAIERFAHHTVVASQPNQSGSFLQRSHQLLDGVKQCAAIRLVADQSQAIRWAIASARPRDTIVVITNGRQQSAHAARTEFAKLETLVQQIRAESESEELSESPSEDGEPIKLRLFR